MQQDLAKFWESKIKELEVQKMLNDPKNLFKHVKNMMGKRNYNQGNYLIYYNTKIFDPQQQTNIFTKTWEKS